jgi:multicomponent Na+:H+ antiporter subunit E
MTPLPETSPPRQPAPGVVPRLAAWSLAGAAAWWIASEGRPGSLGVAIPTVLCAAAVATALVPWPARWLRPVALLRFAGFFLAQSARGGLDVARRALAPSLPIEPELLELTTRLPPGGARVLLADATSLLPGTLAVDLDGDRVLVHALAGGPAVTADFRALEDRVAALLGLPPPEAP